MMGQDFTKLAMILLFVGAALAVAILRPQTFDFAQPTTTTTTTGQLVHHPEITTATPIPGEGDVNPIISQQELDEEAQRLEQLRYELDQRAVDLDTRGAEFDEREIEIATRLAAIQEQETQLEQLRAELEALRVQLEQEQQALAAERAELEHEWGMLQAASDELAQARDELAAAQADLSQAWAELATDRAELLAWQARLNDQEQRVEAYLRWSVATTIISGVLAVPSGIALVALWKEKRRMEQEPKQAQFPRNGHGATELPQYIDKAKSPVPAGEAYKQNGGNGYHN